VALKVSLRETDRLEAFSDGVIAIAATLLVVDLRPPRLATLDDSTLLDALSRLWPNGLAYALSFIFIGIAWAAHHDMFRYIQHTNHMLLMINLLFLMGIALQPFSTALLAEHIGEPTARTAALVYYSILLATSLTYNLVWWYAVSSGLVAEDIHPRLLRALNLEHAVAPILHAMALVVSLWSVALSFIPLGLIYLFFTLPRVSERWDSEKYE